MPEGQNTLIRVVGGRVHFSFSDAREIEFYRDVADYGEKTSDWRPVFDDFGPHVLKSIDKNFQAQGRPRRWARLKPNTIRERIRLGFGRGPILQRTRRLRKGFRYKSGARTFRVTNTQKYFPYHQYGSPKTNLPARKMIVLHATDKATFTKIARKHLTIGGGK